MSCILCRKPEFIFQMLRTDHCCFYRAVMRRWRKWCWQIQFILLSGIHMFWYLSQTVIDVVTSAGFCGFSCTCHLNRESLTVVEQYFPQYALQEQDILGRKESVDKVLALTPEDILFTMCYICIRCDSDKGIQSLFLFLKTTGFDP